jgi:hypothetical protein
MQDIQHPAMVIIYLSQILVTYFLLVNLDASELKNKLRILWKQKQLQQLHNLFFSMSADFQ